LRAESCCSMVVVVGLLELVGGVAVAASIFWDLLGRFRDILRSAASLLLPLLMGGRTMVLFIELLFSCWFIDSSEDEGIAMGGWW